MAGGGQAAPIFGWMARRVAFTMAEILLSLTIIGVVAAITLPSLMGNINERTWNTQRKALHSRMSQAVGMMPAFYEYPNLETFVVEGLTKVIKINNICDSARLSDCGFPDAINPMGGGTPVDTTNGYILLAGGSSGYSLEGAFETLNGESIAFSGNLQCADTSKPISTSFASAPFHVCINFIYDLNGNKGPNTMGKDIGFITVLNPSTPDVVAPMPMPNDAGSAALAQRSALCVANDSSSRLPNLEEMFAIWYNSPFIGNMSESGYYGVSKKYVTPSGDSKTWGFTLMDYIVYLESCDMEMKVRCVKR